MKEDLVVSDVTEKDTDPPESGVLWDGEGVPDPDKQKEIIAAMETECTCTYACSKVWHRKWEEYVGLKGSNKEAEVSIEHKAIHIHYI